MKKKLICFLLAIIALFTICINVAADEASTQHTYITDEAGLLNNTEIAKLDELAENASKKYGVGIYAIAVDNYLNINNEGAYEAAYTIYHNRNMGEGEERNGIMLLISMADRDWAVFCYGKKCEYAFNSYGQSQLEKTFLDNFVNDDWYGGFEDYINECSNYLEMAEQGRPVRKSIVVPIIIAVVAAMLIALIVLGFSWGKMISVSKKTVANSYIVGDLKLSEKADVFAYKNQVRRKIEKSASSDGSSSKSKSGVGGSGRRGKF